MNSDDKLIALFGLFIWIIAIGVGLGFAVGQEKSFLEVFTIAAICTVAAVLYLVLVLTNKGKKDDGFR